MLTDFIVNEITVNGEVVALKEKPNPNLNYNQNNGKKKGGEEVINWEMGEELLGELVGVLGKDAAEAVRELYKRFDSGEKVTQWEYTIENMPEMTK